MNCSMGIIPMPRFFQTILARMATVYILLNVEYNVADVNEDDGSNPMVARSDVVGGVGGVVSFLFNALVQLASSLALKTMMISAAFGVTLASLGIDDFLEFSERTIRKLYDMF